jgi:hypothetical protein
MVEDAAKKDDLIRKTRMLVHMLLDRFPAAEGLDHTLATIQALAISENIHPEEASRFLAENYDAIYRTKGVRDDFTRLMGYENADDPERIANTAKLLEELKRNYENQQESEMTPHFQEGNYALEPGSYELAARVAKRTINPGEAVELEVYITGYGMITGPKLMLTLPKKVDPPRRMIL